MRNGPQGLLRPYQNQLLLGPSDGNIQAPPVFQKVASILFLIAAHQRQEHYILVSALALVNCEDLQIFPGHVFAEPLQHQYLQP